MTCHGEAERLSISRRADAATDRPRFHQSDRLAAGALDRQHAAIRAHEVERAGETRRAQRFVEIADIARDLRPDVGVGGDG